jgi:transcriptional regulator with XRE-family HTH domain
MNCTIKKYLPENLRMLRTLNGLNHEDVSILIGVSRSCYSAYERGDILPTPEAFFYLCNFYNIDPYFMLSTDISRFIFSALEHMRISHNCLGRLSPTKRIAYADTLIKLRLSAGRSLDDTARMLGISRNTYKSYEEGRTTPTLQILSDLAIIYEVTIEVLIGEAPIPYRFFDDK